MSVAERCDQALSGNGQLTALVCAVGLDHIPEQADSRDDGAEVVPIKELAMTADKSAALYAALDFPQTRSWSNN
ncbi:MAG TPA: hypothetical protein VFC19_42390 [Candidatus Limnocylindrales bacterium]|nr:hypothetical protein [Candidatus Limnocylindrales bacterium]